MISKRIFLGWAKKAVISLVILAVAGGGGFYVYKKYRPVVVPARSVVATAHKGALIVSLSGSGQVSSSNQVEIKPKVSGELTYFNGVNSQSVKGGTVLARIDAKDAQRAVRDAQVSIKSAQLELEKLKKPVEKLSLLQAQNALAQASDSLTQLKLSQELTYHKTLDAQQKAKEDLSKAYDDGFNEVSTTFLNLPPIVTGLNDMFYKSSIVPTADNINWYYNQLLVHDAKSAAFRDDLTASYTTARTQYDATLLRYKSASRDSDDATTTSLISDTYITTLAVADAVKKASNYVDFVKDAAALSATTTNPVITNNKASLDSYTTMLNSRLAALLSIKQTIKNSSDTIATSERDLAQAEKTNPLDIAKAQQSIAEKTTSLEKLQAAVDPLDLRSVEISIEQRKNALADAQLKLADYTVTIPFDGVIATATPKKGDLVSASTVLATVITRQKIAEISLNEVDVARVKVGQKATLTFDAVPGLSITGAVINIDPVGTVAQGVVTYGVKIGFDTQDDRIKPSMSVTASIITDFKQSVLLVPVAAVHGQGDTAYVLVVSGDVSPEATSNNGAVLTNEIQQQTVEVGLSNDEFTEIVSGISEGTIVVTRTIQSSVTSSVTPQQSSPFGGAPSAGATRGLSGGSGGVRRGN